MALCFAACGGGGPSATGSSGTSGSTGTSGAGGSTGTSGSGGSTSGSGSATSGSTSGSGSGTSGSTGTIGAAAGAQSGSGASTSAAQAKSIAFASCMRKHGVPSFPDSAVTVAPNGGVLFHLASGSGVDPSSPQFKSAQQACQGLLPHGAAGGGSAANTAALLKYAQCMRAHGEPNFPEPNSSGRIEVQFGRNSPNGINPQSPQYQRAAQACKSLQPPGFAGSAG